MSSPFILCFPTLPPLHPKPEMESERKRKGFPGGFPTILPPIVLTLPSSEQCPLLSFCASPLSLHSILNLRWRVKEKERASLVAQMVKKPPTMQEMQAQTLAQEDPLEEEMTIPSSILAWRIPRTEEPGGIQSRKSTAKS